VAFLTAVGLALLGSLATATIRDELTAATIVEGRSPHYRGHVDGMLEHPVPQHQVGEALQRSGLHLPTHGKVPIAAAAAADLVRACVEMSVIAGKVRCDACGGSHGLWAEAGWARFRLQGTCSSSV
jgi:hypothetical protein